MGLTLIEAAKYENRLEHLAVLKTFSEGEVLAQVPGSASCPLEPRSEARRDSM